MIPWEYLPFLLAKEPIEIMVGSETQRGMRIIDGKVHREWDGVPCIMAIYDRIIEPEELLEDE